MSDEAPPFTPPMAAIPSRTPATPAFLDQPSPGTRRGLTGDILKPRKRAAKKAAPKARKAARKAPVKKAAPRKIVKRAKKAAPAPRPPKNPNRPLEMKNQMQAVLAIAGQLQKGELQFFTQAAAAMQTLTRSGRRRVITALQQVYG